MLPHTLSLHCLIVIGYVMTALISVIIFLIGEKVISARIGYFHLDDHFHEEYEDA